MREKIRQYISLTLWIAVYLIIAGIIGDMTRHEIPGWYTNLIKPPLNPPDFIFPIVWTLLYIMIAIAGWRIWQLRSQPYGKAFLGLFALQTLMNWVWSYLFFDYHWLGFSFIWILGLVACVAFLISWLWARHRITALILIPYLTWIAFASYLNGMIWYLN